MENVCLPEVCDIAISNCAGVFGCEKMKMFLFGVHLAVKRWVCYFFGCYFVLFFVVKVQVLFVNGVLFLYCI